MAKKLAKYKKTKRIQISNLKQIIMKAYIQKKRRKTNYQWLILFDGDDKGYVHTIYLETKIYLN